MIRALLASSALIVSTMCALPATAIAAPQPAGRCAALAERLYGADGQGGEVARYRAAHIASEKMRLADAIVADAKARAALHCAAVRVANIASPAPSATIVASTASPTRTASPAVIGAFPSLPPGALGVTTTVRSLHGCVGFNGAWAAPYGVLQIHDGTATLGTTAFSGHVTGNVFRGQWNDPKIGSGTFVFALADDGDSLDAALVNANGSNGAYRARCSGSA